MSNARELEPFVTSEPVLPANLQASTNISHALRKDLDDAAFPWRYNCVLVGQQRIDAAKLSSSTSLQTPG